MGTMRRIRKVPKCMANDRKLYPDADTGICAKMDRGIVFWTYIHYFKNKLFKGEAKFVFSGDLSLASWLDNGLVTTASTLPYYRNEMSTCWRNVLDHNKQWTGKQALPCPRIVTLYNSGMG